MSDTGDNPFNTSRHAAAMTVDTQTYRTGTLQEQAAALAKYPPNFLDRVAIRSIWDGRYRFSRYISPGPFQHARFAG